jgi:hypothetical protein
LKNRQGSDRRNQDYGKHEHAWPLHYETSKAIDGTRRIGKI